MCAERRSVGVVWPERTEEFARVENSFATRLVGMTDWAAVAIDFRNLLQAVKTIGADGVQVFYRQAGPADGPVLLLLQGSPTSSLMFRESIPRMASRYRVIAPELPGFGFTECRSRADTGVRSNRSPKRL